VLCRRMTWSLAVSGRSGWAALHFTESSRTRLPRLGWRRQPMSVELLHVFARFGHSRCRARKGSAMEWTTLQLVARSHGHRRNEGPAGRASKTTAGHGKG